MDDIVLAALKKWPDVPHCRGWLGLDARGTWYLRDERVQSRGPFPLARGSAIEHDKLRAFIGRNYACDAAGCWYFQNGPQRVYVELEAAPWIWRVEPGVDAGGRLVAHTGAPAVARTAWLDSTGRIFVDTDIGLGLVHSLDAGLAADALELGAWPLAGELPFDRIPERFGYVLSPAARAAA